MLQKKPSLQGARGHLFELFPKLAEATRILKTQMGSNCTILHLNFNFGESRTPVQIAPNVSLSLCSKTRWLLHACVNVTYHLTLPTVTITCKHFQHLRQVLRQLDVIHQDCLRTVDPEKTHKFSSVWQARRAVNSNRARLYPLVSRNIWPYCTDQGGHGPRAHS